MQVEAPCPTCGAPLTVTGMLGNPDAPLAPSRSAVVVVTIDRETAAAFEEHAEKCPGFGRWRADQLATSLTRLCGPSEAS